MKFDIYKITDRVFSRYGEMRVAEELQKMGFDVFEPLNDSYIDLVARIRKCRKCGSFLMKKELKKCEKCESGEIYEIFKTIQVKSSRIEGGGDGNSYAVDHKPKDMLHDKRHYFVWVFYDRKGEEFFQCCRMSEFVIFSSGKKGNFVSNHTWWTDRGRLHLTIDENTGFPSESNIPKTYRHTLDYLLEEHDTSTVDEIITQQEKDQKWKTTKKITEFEINKNFLKTKISGLVDANGESAITAINSKSRIWKIINDEPISFHLSNRLDDSRLGKSKFSQKVYNTMFEMSMIGWVALTNVNKANEIIMMRIRCKHCKKLWDQEEKECYNCKTWSAPVYICKKCGVAVPEESKRACGKCKTQRGVKFCMKCDYKYFNNATEARRNTDSTYFVPITFCQNCGMRENEFDFEELK